MAAKLREKDGFWWVVIHHRGRRKWKKIGSDKREAQKVAHKINAQLALGEFAMEDERVPTVEEALRRWFKGYKPTFSPSFADVAETNIERHLIPAFGKLRITEIEERHLLQFIGEKTAEGTKPGPLKASTISNILSVLRRVLALAVDDGVIQRNPCRNLGRLLAKVKRQQSEQVEHVSAWSREEVAKLLEVARENEPGFCSLLAFLLHTGCRKGEARAVKWEDVDWYASRVLIRRSISRGRLTPPKSGKARSVALSPALAVILRDLLSQRRKECLKRGWPDVPEWIFCSETGGLLDERNVTRSWYRVRRKAQANGVRPLRLHDARHTYASLMLRRGVPPAYVSRQLGHSSIQVTVDLYGHFIPRQPRATSTKLRLTRRSARRRDGLVWRSANFRNDVAT